MSPLGNNRERGRCPHCDVIVVWTPPQDTIACGGCGERLHPEYLKPVDPQAQGQVSQ